MENGLKLVKRVLRKKTGVEGPPHDPYGYDEMIVEKQYEGCAPIIVKWHSGLSDRIEIQAGGPVCKLDWTTFVHADEQFKNLTGMDCRDFEKAYERKKFDPIRKHPCGTKHIRWVDGYPGEYLRLCGKCGSILDSYVNMSEVE